MKRLAALALLMAALAGCAGEDRDIQRGMDLRSKILAAESCSFTADITADYGDELFEFTMDCASDAEGNLSFCVVQPESISGISGMIEAAKGQFTFDGHALQFDLMADEQIIPVSAPWILMKSLRGGYLSSACMEGDLLRLTLNDSYEEDSLHVDIWINARQQPVHSEILYDGVKILTVDVRDFVIL